ncbi:MAG: hypothetical protein E7252_10265 [Lachnospira sp.]|nr:hypothetical protein [Lachnospira sp.]
MLTVRETIRNSSELQQLLEKSKCKRYKKLKESKDYCEKNKIRRELALEEQYPIEEMIRKKKVFPILKFLVRARLIFSGINIKKLNTFDRSNIENPVIYVPTHIAKNDIEVVYSCIENHALLLSGTEDRMYRSLNGFFLERNGVNYVDRNDKTDRRNSVRKMGYDLEHGFDLLWFIEGTWNLSANKLVYPISYSVIKLALKYNAAIVPIGLNQIKKDVYIKFGTVFYVDSMKLLEDSALELRDILATLKWDIYEYIKQTRKDGYINRRSLSDDYWEKYLIERVKEWPMTDLIEELNYVFYPKDDSYRFYEEFIGGNK